MIRLARVKGDARGVYRPRVAIPVDDEVAIEWLDSQFDLSHSLRVLIYAWVAEHGMTDPVMDVLSKPLKKSRGVVRKNASGSKRVSSKPSKVSARSVSEVSKPVSAPPSPVSVPVSVTPIETSRAERYKADHVSVQTPVSATPETPSTTSPRFVLPEPKAASEDSGSTNSGADDIAAFLAANRD